MGATAYMAREANGQQSSNEEGYEMSFNLSKRSKDRLKGVHPDLVAVVERAIELTGVDFGVTCGVRTIEEQEANVAAGRSQTMRSKHLPQEDGYSQAVDVVAYVGPEVSWS